MERLEEIKDRPAREGLVGIFTGQVGSYQLGALLEVNCETDFVARNAGKHELVFVIFKPSRINCLCCFRISIIRI